MEDGPRVLVISGSLPNKKRITISGVYVAPDNWKNSFTEIDNFLTSTYIKIKPGHIIEGVDFNINTDKKSEEKKNLSMFYDHLTKNNLIDSIKAIIDLLNLQTIAENILSDVVI